MCIRDRPGNVRELEHTLWRAQFLWSQTREESGRTRVSDWEIQHAIALSPLEQERSLLHADLPVSLEDVLMKVSKHYIEKALRESKTKTKAAELLGYEHHQTLRYKMKTLGLLEPREGGTSD